MSYFNIILDNISIVWDNINFDIETLGYIGSVLLAICGIPETIRAIINKRCDIGWLMLLSWFSGEVLFFIYLISKFFSWQTLINYGTNIIAVGILLIYKYKGAKSDRRQKD